MKRIINIDQEILGGTPVFSGTRVPIKNLFDYIEEGEDKQAFLEDFPTVEADQVDTLLHLAQELILNTTKLAHENITG
ncbi:MAG: DUF433 domain-containing protein [Bacteroidota bacterium]